MSNKTCETCGGTEGAIIPVPFSRPANPIRRTHVREADCIDSLLATVRRVSGEAEDLCSYGPTLDGPSFDDEIARLHKERDTALDRLAAFARGTR